MDKNHVETVPAEVLAAVSEDQDFIIHFNHSKIKW